MIELIKKLSKQDRQGVRKPSDVERKYDLGEIQQTVRVIQENQGSNIPENALANYYTKSEVDYILSSIKPNEDYRIVDDVIEWINPPMQLDTEYRTTERWLGKPVYTKLVEQDISLRGSTTDEYEVPYQIVIDVVTPSFENCIRATGHTTGYSNYFIPQISENGYMVFKSVAADKIEIDVKNYLFTNDAHLYIQVWYTKTE